MEAEFNLQYLDDYFSKHIWLVAFIFTSQKKGLGKMQKHEKNKLITSENQMDRHNEYKMHVKQVFLALFMVVINFLTNLFPYL